MTQYEIELIQEAQNRKWEKEKRVEIFTINTLMRMFSKNAKAISWINILGIFKKKLKQVTEFEPVECLDECLLIGRFGFIPEFLQSGFEGCHFLAN